MKIQCFTCGKVVTNEISDRVLFRATAECPECAEKEKIMENAIDTALIYSLIAEMEALKAEVEVLKREWPEGPQCGGEHLFQEKANEIRAISEELKGLAGV